MESNRAYCETLVIRSYEGGYVNDKRDPGGPTNLGITQAVLSGWNGHPATIAEVQALTLDQACAIYDKQYWAPVRCDDLPSGIDLLAYNYAVQCGPTMSARLLQRALCALGHTVALDGNVGASTIAAVRAADAKKLIPEIVKQAQAYFEKLKGFKDFGKGWTSRNVNIQARALDMVGREQVPVNASPAVIAALHPEIDDGHQPAPDRASAKADTVAPNKTSIGKSHLAVIGGAVSAAIGNACEHAGAFGAAGEKLRSLDAAGHTVVMLGTGLTVVASLLGLVAVFDLGKRGELG